MTVLELGASTGTISKAIGPRLGPGARHLALDRDPTLLSALDHHAPWAQQVVADVTDLAGALAAVKVDTVDVVISSLPWSNFAPEVQHRVLDHLASVLDPGGVFATIAYRPARLIGGTRTFRAALDASFGQVHATATEWRSVPPARVLVCRRPRRLP